MYDVKVPVLIIGGGPVGLSSALFLGRHGVKTLLVEKRGATSRLPRAPGLQARTMELWRAAGLLKEIRALEKGNSHEYFEGGIIQVRTFAEIDDAILLESPSLDGPRVSPERVMGCGQDRYERVLVDKVIENGGDILFRHEIVDLSQDDEGVTATIEDLESGTRKVIRADWMIGADGASSFVREHLGVQREGRGVVFNALSIYFSAPELEVVLKNAKFILCYATAAPGTLMGLSRLHGCDPWLAAPIYFPEKGEKPEDFTDERCIDIVRTASGKADMEVTIQDKVPWQGAQLVAERFRIGRIFLAGDAGHVHPPAGGFGANTGIHDSHNLAWKLSAVIKGWAGDRLLDSYDAERRGVGDAMAEQAMVRNRIRHGHADEETKAKMVDDIIVTLGYRYKSDALVGVDADAPTLTPQLTLTGQPGTRAPHVWLDRDGEQISTIDLFWDKFVLLVAPGGQAWADAAERAAKEAGVPLVSYVVGEGGDLTSTDWDWAETYGVSNTGAVLVRPDAFVAWRSPEIVEDPDSVIADVVHRAAGLES
jgi:putative polyketide hydroxylase